MAQPRCAPKGTPAAPRLFLLISGVVNVSLNLIFVIPLQMNVAGVALATVTSQALSACLILRCLSRSGDALCFSWNRLCLDKRSLVDMARIGIPAGVQSCLFSLANVSIQSAINSYDSIIMAGSSASENIENFLYSSMNAFHHACQTFTSQNVGAGRYDRIPRIVGACLLCVFVLGVAQSALAVCFAHPLISIYNSEPAVIAAGAQRMAIIAAPYAVFGMADVLVGAIPRLRRTDCAGRHQPAVYLCVPPALDSLPRYRQGRGCVGLQRVPDYLGFAFRGAQRVLAVPLAA